MKCLKCKKNRATVSAIVNGELVKDICESCYQNLVISNSQSSGSANYERERSIENNAADLAQPHGADGKPSSAFIRLYPNQAKQMFTPEELRLYG